MIKRRCHYKRAYSRGVNLNREVIFMDEVDGRYDSEDNIHEWLNQHFKWDLVNCVHVTKNLESGLDMKEGAIIRSSARSCIRINPFDIFYERHVSIGCNASEIPKEISALLRVLKEKKFEEEI